MIIEEITEENYKEKLTEGEELQKDIILKLKQQSNTKTPNWFLFLDPAIWAYHFLKDKQNKPLMLRPFQIKLIRDKAPYVVCVAANQIGKTWTACIKAIHHALHVNNASVLIVSKSEQQAVMILDEIKWMLKRAGIDFDPVLDEVQNRTELHIKNPDKKGVSVIRCLPCTMSVLAFPATLLICDEIGFWEIDKMKQIEYFNRVIVSRTLETRNWQNEHFTMGQIFCISNPNAQQGVLWHLWNDSDCNQYRYCWLSSPKNTIEFYSKQKKKITVDEFDSVYAAVFSSASGGFITQDEYNDAVQDYSPIPPITEPIYIGGDFAGEDTISRDVDSTVLFGAVPVREADKEPRMKVMYYKEYPLRTKKQVVYNDLLQFKSNMGLFCYDKAGVGDSVKNDLLDKQILSEYKIEPLTYSLPNKSDVYYNMKHLFEQRRITIPDIPKLKEQLLGLRFEKTDAGHIKVHHAKEGLHDDYADALANCCWATLRALSAPVTLSIVVPQPKKAEKKGRDLIYNEKKDLYEWG